MTQNPLADSTAELLLATIDPETIGDEQVRETFKHLLNAIEQLKSKIKELQTENQRLRDENNRLKGEQGQPKIKPNRQPGSKNNHSSERERCQPKEHKKGKKNEFIKIDREQVLKVQLEQLPPDAEFKGYEEVIVQDIKITTDNVLFRKEKYYSPSLGKTYLAEVPAGYEGQFGPGLKALVISQYFQGNMTEAKLQEFLSNIGIFISAGQVSNLLIKNGEIFETEKVEVYQAGLESSPWQHFDQTAARVAGNNQTCNIVCNPWYTVYATTENKDRLTVLDVLQGGIERQFLLNEEAFTLLKTFNIPQKIIAGLLKLPQAILLGEATFREEISRHLPQRGSIQLNRILEAAAIAAYHSQTDWPVVQALVCDDAPQFKLLTEQLALCWVHEGRHYKKLSPSVGYHRQHKDKFLKDYWDYYRQLLLYREQPSLESAEKLRQQFRELFAITTGYKELDERIRLTGYKESELLLVLEHPEIPLHNNPAELGARTMVRRRLISYGTHTAEGTKAWDTFLSLVATTRQLGLSFFEYVRDRISQLGQIKPLAQIIREKANASPLGESWLQVWPISPNSG